MSKPSDNNPKNIRDFAIPVRRSIIHRDLWIGIPFIPLITLVFISVLFIFGFGQLAFIAVTIISWIILRQFTKKDEWLLDIILNSLFQPDDLR
jgi:hypothetical protein